MTTMKAIILTRYGSVDYLEMRDADKPVPGDDDVLVRVRATSVNDWDWQIVMGTPWVNRALAGWTRPHKLNVLGCDMAGVVEAVGRHVTGFRAGDPVFGDLCTARASGSPGYRGFGALGEYVSVRADCLHALPEGLSFPQAAALPHAGRLMWVSLFAHGDLHPGQKILVNGAGGGVGTLAMQLGKRHGAEMTAVDAPHKLARLRELGYDHVIDYTREDFTRLGMRYDLVIDVKTNRSAFAYPRVLVKGGMYASCGGTLPRLFHVLVTGGLVKLATGKRIRILGMAPTGILETLGRLAAEGRLIPEIDCIFPLSDSRDAFRRFGEQGHTGKIIITQEGP